MPKTPPEETIYDGKFLRFVKAGKYEYVKRASISGVVVILPLTRDRDIILTEQFRVPLGRRVVALPAGLAGDGKHHHEPLMEAAKRELLEETGYAAERWAFLAEGPSSSGLTDEIITFFFAKDVALGGKAKPEAGEEIEVHKVPLNELSGWLEQKRQRGCLIDYKIFAAIHLADGIIASF